MVSDDLSVVAAVQRDLAELGKVAPDLAGSGLAASALVLAAELDDQSNSATSKSMCARALTETLEKLRSLTPEKPERSALDDLTARREARLAGGAGA